MADVHHAVDQGHVGVGLEGRLVARKTVALQISLEIQLQHSKMVTLEQEAMAAQEEQAAQRKVFSDLTDSVAILTLDNAQLKEKEKAAREREKLVEEAKQKGYAIVEEAVWEYGLKNHGDKWPNDAIGLLFNCRIVTNAKNHYHESLTGRFDEREIDEIMASLEKHQMDLAPRTWKSLKK